ncbi:MAG: alpha-amylase, partial [Bacteroides sp.]|nr:alpha-amylase [Bacteroides sp.]
IDNEELNSLLTTIKNQDYEIAELNKKIEKLQAKADKEKKEKTKAPAATVEQASEKVVPPGKPVVKKAPAKKTVAKKSSK